MPFRSRRLEALLGAEFDELTYRHFIDVEGNPNSVESDDLDWKIRYDEDKDAAFEIAKDVAALANSSGGLLVLGVAQDKATSAAKKVLEHPTTDHAEREIHQAIAARAYPLPPYQVRRLANPDGDGTSGIIAIAVSPSPYAPHAVLAAQRPEYAYPRRTGNKIQWLSEPEVATAYRRRFIESGSRDSRLDDVEADVIEAFYATESREPLLTVSLVPEIPGNFRIDRPAFEKFQRTMLGALPIGVNNQITVRQVTVSSARLQTTDDRIHPKLHCDFHSDGSGAWGVVPRVHLFSQEEGDDTGSAQIHYIVTQTLNALLTLAQHATEGAGTFGTALIRVSLWSSVFDHPSTGMHMPVLGQAPPYKFSALRLGSFVRNCFEDEGVRAAESSTSNSVAILDSINRPGVGLTRTAAFALSELLHAFGIIDVPQIREDGAVRPHAFSRGDDNWWIEWCENNEVPVVE